jgi:hypothetical protein
MAFRAVHAAAEVTNTPIASPMSMSMSISPGPGLAWATHLSTIQTLALHDALHVHSLHGPAPAHAACLGETAPAPLASSAMPAAAAPRTCFSMAYGVSATSNVCAVCWKGTLG